MGWYGSDKCFANSKEFFEHEFAVEIREGKKGGPPNSVYSVLDYVIKKDDDLAAVVYAACMDENGKKFGAVFLIDKTEEDGKFIYKPLSENSEPCYYDCPKKILKQLDAPANENAARWRLKCGDTKTWPVIETTAEEQSTLSFCP